MKLTWKEKIAYLAWVFKSMDKEAPTYLSHIFKNGSYIRDLHIPRDTLFIGREHIHGHMLHLLDGEVYTFHARSRLHHVAYDRMQTMPGMQVIAYTLTDIHVRGYFENPDNCQDVETLENRFAVPAETTIALGAEINNRLGSPEKPTNFLEILKW